MNQQKRLLLWMLASFASSIAGVVYAISWGTACDGGRGGAVAVAFAFGALFTARSLPAKYIEQLDSAGVPQFDSLPVDERIKGLKSALAVLLDRQRLETLYLTLASVSGALVLGFGDLIAGAFGAAPCY